jgi:hypothetical protein
LDSYYPDDDRLQRRSIQWIPKILQNDDKILRKEDGKACGRKTKEAQKRCMNQEKV